MSWSTEVSGRHWEKIFSQISPTLGTDDCGQPAPGAGPHRQRPDPRAAAPQGQCGATYAQQAQASGDTTTAQAFTSIKGDEMGPKATYTAE
ncbi:hypothetical protein [Streptomyces sp. CA-106110]|uniref:hypothetical protein n=1 Tax=Streptomyces sp. CA-106110 TaxID=3240044 RepID=UPI003D8E8DBA